MKRRNFIKGLGSAALGGLAYSILGDELVKALAFDFVSKAHASASDPVKNFIHLHLAGGPNRMQFDQFFTLNEGERKAISDNTSQYSHHLGSQYRIINGRYAGTDYNLIPSHGILVPPIWDVVTGAGEKGRDSLLNNWVTFRAYKMGSDGHQECTEAQVRPQAGKPSFSGSFLDRYANTELGGLQDSAGYWMVAKYRSAKAIVAPSISIHWYNSMQDNVNRTYREIFSPFLAGTGSKKNSEGFLKTGGNQEKFDNLARILASSNVTGRAEASALRSGVQASRALVNRIAESLEVELLGIAQKYKAAIDRSVMVVIPGVSDKEFLMPLAPSGNEPDLRLHFQPGAGNPAPNNAADSCNIVKNYWANQKTYNSMAMRFAVAEFLIKNKFVNHVMLNLDQGNFNFVNLIDNKDGSKMDVDVPYDSHNRGCGLALLTESYMYLGLMTCLQIFKTATVELNIFKDTVFEISSEFARTPRRDGSGSDHGGSNAIVTSVLSGAIQNGPLVIGNVVESPKGETGDWGVNNGRAGVIYEIGKTPDPADVLHSIGDIIGYKVPWETTSTSLVRVESGGNISSVHTGGRHGRLIKA
jgi:hypothetical protein